MGKPGPPAREMLRKSNGARTGAYDHGAPIRGTRTGDRRAGEGACNHTVSEGACNYTVEG